MYSSGNKAVGENSKWYIPIRANIGNSYDSTCLFVLICHGTALYLHGTRRYKVVHGGTRWYMAVQATIYRGTCRYKAV
jgi:hypothetical protein